MVLAVAGCASSGMQRDINADCIEAENDQTVPGRLQDTSIQQGVHRGGPGCLNRFSASISGASAKVRLPSGGAAT